MYLLTFASIHSHKDANILHTTHMYTSAITNTHTHTHHNICTHYYHIYMYMNKQYQTPSDIIHIPTVHNVSVLAYIIT